MSNFETLNVIRHAEFSPSQLEKLFDLEIGAVSDKNRGDSLINFKKATEIAKEFKGKITGNPVVTIANDKGGVGKTLVTYQLSQRLQLDGNRVLVIDLDGQRNLTNFYVNGEPSFSIVDYFKDPENMNLSDICIDIDDTLSVLPATTSVGRLNSILDRYLYFNEEDKEFTDNVSVEKLESFSLDFKKLRKQYDIILIDSPPNFGLSNFVAFSVSTNILIPVEPERHNVDSIEAVNSFVEIVEELMKLEERINVQYFFNEVRPHDKKSAKSAKDIISSSINRTGRDLLGVHIPFSTLFNLANTDGVPFFLADIYNPTNEQIEEMMSLIRAFNLLIEEVKVNKQDLKKSSDSFRAAW